ncbi:MAG: hypothetical protein R3336_03870 [Phycisphaeraceae bacterium]|nr:hypothetical protein [Phycisphaeraceae bacterium]
MKDATKYAKKLEKLQKKLLSKYEPEPAMPLKPVLRLVHAFLSWNASRTQADNAYDRLMATVVEPNELRVTHADDILDALGPRYPLGEERTARMLDAMNEIYDRQRDTDLSELEDWAKKDVRQYLQTLPGIVPYVEASVSLLAFDAHAVPVDEKLVAMLDDEEVIDEEAPMDEVNSFLERYIMADDGVETHLAFQAWTDEEHGRVTSKKIRNARRKVREVADAKGRQTPPTSQMVQMQKASARKSKVTRAAAARGETMQDKKGKKSKKKSSKKKSSSKKKKSSKKSKKK